MRKFYTNLLQVSLSFAIILLMGSTATAQCDVPPPDGAVWGTQFDGGLDGWTALDGNFAERKRADGTDIGWEWTADGDVSAGAFAGNAPAYASLSICNGAMSLNSDFLDNLGTDPPTFGGGECPGTCSSILLSPTIDLSEADGSDFVLQFASQHRQFTSTYSILLSTDDGATWIDTFTVFPDGYIEGMTNSPHLFNLQERVPLCGLGNEREVRLAILYDANYYYWTIDDFYIISEDKPDLRVNDNWFGTSVTYGVPADQTFPLAFISDIENRSPIGSDGSVLNVTIEKNGFEVHSQMLDYGPIAGCADNQNQVFPLTYEPDAAPGDVYTVNYNIVDNGDDAIMENNVKSADFEFTVGDYVKLIPESITGGTYRDSRFGAETRLQSFGSGFYVKNAMRGGEQAVVEAINFGLEAGSADADPLASGTVEVTVYEWFDIDLDGEVDGDPANEKVKVGTVTVLTDLLEDERNISVIPLTEDGDRVALNDNTQYIVMCHYNPFDGVSYYHTIYSPSELNRNYFDQPMEFGFVEIGNDAVTWPDAPANISARIGTLGAVDGVTHDDRDGARNFIPVFWGTSYVNIAISGTVGAEDINENIGINVFPNPASEKVTADVVLENTSEVVNVEVVDMTGKVVQTSTFKNVKNDKLTIDVSTLTDGMYLMNIRTDEGINSQKFSVHNVK